MSGDGRSKLAPEMGPQQAEPLDDIILHDDPTDAPPPVAPKTSSPPPLQRASLPSQSSSLPPAPSTRKDAAEARIDAHDGQGRRAKMTLRIPDDEIARPHLVTPAAFRLATIPSGPPSPLDLANRPMSEPIPAPHDESFETSRAVREGIAEEGSMVPSPAVGIDASHEPGWTPFQPEVEHESLLPRIAPTPIIELNHGSSNGDGHDRLRTAQPQPTMLDIGEVDNSGPPSSEDIPVDTDLSGIAGASSDRASSDDLATAPRLPMPMDSEEIRIDDGDRSSETGEVEVEPEDLVSVESLPSEVLQPPPVKASGKHPGAKASDLTQGMTATSLMAGVPPPAAVSSRPAVSTAGSPTSTPTGIAGSVAVTPAQTGASQPHLAVASTSASPARRPSSPLVFVPPMGALAPPPLTETAAARKKARPWWEELFNDDFIRTMAKVTDAQIGKEVTFIEESLGCEAGAMILDLACGTGRHAVELAARGYQVVGFDLSLAMLARASDEAQDRKQKLNFVQGDMREMTFEETFDGIYSWNTSFGYFDEEKNGGVVARVHKALKKGGQFLLDVVNRDYIIRQAPSLAWFEGDGCICMDEMTIDFITSRMKVKRTLMMDDGRTKEIEYSIRAYALHELGKMLHDNGFRVAEVSGRTGTPGVFFGCESPRTLILAEKR